MLHNKIWSFYNYLISIQSFYHFVNSDAAWIFTWSIIMIESLSRISRVIQKRLMYQMSLQLVETLYSKWSRQFELPLWIGQATGIYYILRLPNICSVKRLLMSCWLRPRALSRFLVYWWHRTGKFLCALPNWICFWSSPLVSDGKSLWYWRALSPALTSVAKRVEMNDLLSK